MSEITKLFDTIDRKFYIKTVWTPADMKCANKGCEKYETTYGEITYSGMEKVLDEVNKYHKLYPVSSNRKVFVDLGCGFGRFNMFAALLYGYDSYGIEIVDHRVDQAKVALNNMKNKGFNEIDKVKIIKGSIVDEKLMKPILESSSVIFISNLCFNQELQTEVFNLLNKYVPKNCLIACSQEINKDPNVRDYKSIKYIKTFPAEMTWMADSVLALYRKA